MKQLIPKYQSPSSTLPEREYLPEYEYEFVIVDNLPNKPKDQQFEPQAYAEKHKRITNEQDWQKYWGNQGAASVSSAINQAGLKLMPYALGLANPLTFASGMIGGEVFDDGTRAASNGKYQDWGSMVSNKTGMNPIVSQMTNPGYLVGGAMGESIRFSPTTEMNSFQELGNLIRNIKIQRKLPLKFNNEAMYRIIGREGYDDAIQNKILRPNMNVHSKNYRGVNKYWTWFTKGHPNDRNHPVTFKDGSHPWDAIYPGDVIVEVSPEHPQFSTFQEHLKDAEIYKTHDMISTESPYVRFFKRGKKGKYFEIPNLTYDGHFLPDLTLENLIKQYIPHRTVPIKNRFYRVLTNSKKSGDTAEKALFDAQKTGIIRANPRGTFIDDGTINGKRESYVGPYFGNSKNGPKIHKGDKVIVENDNTDIQWKEIPDHFVKDQIPPEHIKSGQFTPVYKGEYNKAPTRQFRFFEQGNNWLTKNFWFEKLL